MTRLALILTPSTENDDRAILESTCSNHGFSSIVSSQTTSEALSALSRHPTPTTIIIVKLGKDETNLGLPVIQAACKTHPQAFKVVYSKTASTSALVRQQCFDVGANMVTNCEASLAHALNLVSQHLTDLERRRNQYRTSHTFTCPWCRMELASEKHLWEHVPLYHVNVDPKFDRGICPICHREEDRLQRHIHHEHNPNHGPVGSHSYQQTMMGFALVLVRHPTTNKFLLVQEYANSGYWLPGGKVDPGESFTDAAIRETKEEAGVDIELEGILSIQVNSKAYKRHTRMRIIFLGRPRDLEQLPKSIPDFESVGATWASSEEIFGDDLRWRGNEVFRWCNHLLNGMPVHDLSVLADVES